MWTSVFAASGFVLSILALALSFIAIRFTARTAGPELRAQIDQLAHEFTEQIKSVRRDISGLTTEWGETLEAVTKKQKQAQGANARAAKLSASPGAVGEDGFDPNDPNVDRAQLAAYLASRGRM